MRVLNIFMEELQKPFPFYLNDDRKNLLLIAGISVFVVFFLAVFSPFQESYSLLFIASYAVIVFVMLTFNIVVLPRVFPNWFDNENWTLSRYLFFKIYTVILIGTAITIINVLFKGWENCSPLVMLWFMDLTHVTLIGMFPILTVTLILKDSLIRANKLEGQQATRKLQSMDKKPMEPNMTAIQCDTLEKLELSLADFLFAEASDNYSHVYWKGEEGNLNKLLRITLKNLETQIANNHIVRCHRSYLVNLNAVSEVTGNVNGYKLSIENVDKKIPVSRILGKDILQRIDSL